MIHFNQQVDVNEDGEPTLTGPEIYLPGYPPAGSWLNNFRVKRLILCDCGDPYENTIVYEAIDSFKAAVLEASGDWSRGD